MDECTVSVLKQSMDTVNDLFPTIKEYYLSISLDVIVCGDFSDYTINEIINQAKVTHDILTGNLEIVAVETLNSKVEKENK
ncbi:hypothetical protein SDC9_55027 [bioreactor metagenome]|uniref:Uncharacterized protein n=1 Tax=bioreactor metagenome TaxID=1076179 RepID=A0A644X341_9ZZZZ